MNKESGSVPPPYPTPLRPIAKVVAVDVFFKRGCS